MHTRTPSRPCIRPRPYTHTHIRTSIHTNTHTHTRTRTPFNKLSHTCFLRLMTALGGAAHMRDGH